MQQKEVSYQTIYDQLYLRDQNDLKCQHSPLVIDKQAILIDTTNRNITQVLDLVRYHVDCLIHREVS